MYWQPSATDRVLLAGKTGNGKSEKAKEYCFKIFRTVLWQPMQDWKIGGVDPIYVDEFEQMDGSSGLLRVTIYPTEYDRDTMKDEHERVCAKVYAMGALCFISEEIALVCDNSRGERPDRNYSRLLVTGRHRGVSLVSISQRLAQMPLDVRSSANRLICFKQTEPKDIEAFEERLYPLESPVSINMLERYHYIDWQEQDNGAATVALRTPIVIS